MPKARKNTGTTGVKRRKYLVKKEERKKNRKEGMRKGDRKERGVGRRNWAEMGGVERRKGKRMNSMQFKIFK